MIHVTANWWIRLHRRGAMARFILRGTILLVVVLGVCYPRPGLLWRHIQHFRDPNAMIEPDAPELVPLLAEMRPLLERTDDPKHVLRIVEACVRFRIPYAFDWDTWGVVDYMPTVKEVLEAGREDCDGRALVAASLLRNLGIRADIVWDGAHVWVWTPHGETMGPNPIKTVHVTDEGRVIHWAGLLIIPRASAFGLAVFPLSRELIVAGALWLVLLAPGVGAIRAAGGGISLLLGLMLIRVGGRDWSEQWAWAYGLGYASVAGVVIAATLGAARARARGVLNDPPAHRPSPVERDTSHPRRSSPRRSFG